MRKFCLLSLLLVSLCALPGCSLKSRYAMDNPIYADKYADGAEKGDWLGKLKQAMDARQTDEMDGLYLSGGVQSRDTDAILGGGELGYETYTTNWLTLRGAFAIYGNDGQGYGGLDLGVRVQPPSRVAPFVGLGLFNGVSRGDEIADGDFIDNDDDNIIDEPGERRTTVDGWMTAVYPEVGVHAWLNGSWRASAFGRYFVTTHGRSDDHWLLGFQITAFTH